MKSRLGPSILFLIIAFPSALPAGESFDSTETFGEWVTYYYLHPDPSRIPGALDFYCESGLYDKQNTRIPLAQLFATAITSQPSIQRTVANLIIQDKNHELTLMAAHVLWLINSPGANELLQESRDKTISESIPSIIDRMLTTPPPNYLEQPPTSPVSIDVLWSQFFASGDASPVERIAHQVHLVEDGSGAEILVGGAARWSLISNMQQHERVREIVKEMIPGADETHKPHLERALEEARQAFIDGAE